MHKARMVSLCLIVAVALAGAASAQQPLFEILGYDQFPSKAAVDTREIALSSRLLESKANSVALTLFSGKSYNLHRDLVEKRGEGNLLWKGSFEGDTGRAILTLKEGFVVGLIYSPEGTYELLTTSHGGQILSKIDHNAYDECETPHHPSEKTSAKWPFGFDLPETRQATTKATSLIDVMSLWTPQAESAAGGAAQMAATAQSAIDVTNDAFANSNVDVLFTLVHSQLINYNDSGSLSSDRNWVRNDPIANSLRDQYGADLVGLIVENGGGGCGIAFLMGNEDPAAFAPNGYQVTDRGCAVGNLTYAHEHGHNMGLQHNPENGASSSNATYVWSYGHYVNGSYRTVMSYSNPCSQGCTRVTQWSNPNINYLGVPTGIANARDNARTLGLISPFTANYRPAGGTGTSLAISTSGRKVQGKHVIDVSWAGAGSSQVDIVRDGGVVTTTANDGAYTDNTGNKGRGSYDYQVCEAGTSTCSSTSTVNF